MSDINTGGEQWGNDWIERVETAAEKYGVECHGVPLNVGWFLNLLDAAVKKERADSINDFLDWLLKNYYIKDDHMWDMEKEEILKEFKEQKQTDIEK